MAQAQHTSKARALLSRRMIIHCGVQKTASTSLHHFLQRNKAALGAHLQVLTPVKGSLTRKIGRTAMQFSLDPVDALETQLTSHIRALRDELLTGTMPVLLSHENLPGAMIGNGGVTTLYPHLEHIIRLLNANLDPIEPDYVFYSREMNAWKQSVYGQVVKSDRYPHPREVFLETTRDCGSWDDLHRRLDTLLGADRMRLFQLEQEPDASKPGTQLLRFAGLNDEAIAMLNPLERRANTGLNAGALEFLRLINTLGLDRQTRTRMVDLVSANQPLFSTGATGAA